MDTEDDDEISIGCAGGVDLTSTGTYEPEGTISEGNSAYRIVVKEETVVTAEWTFTRASLTQTSSLTEL